jgi:hypothetical protein
VVGEGLLERVVGPIHFGVSLAGEDLEAAVAGVREDVLQEPGLADAALASDKDGPRRAVVDRRQVRAKRLTLRVPVDERVLGDVPGPADGAVCVEASECFDEGQVGTLLVDLRQENFDLPVFARHGHALALDTLADVTGEFATSVREGVNVALAVQPDDVPDLLLDQSRLFHRRYRRQQADPLGEGVSGSDRLDDVRRRSPPLVPLPRFGWCLPPLPRFR